MLLLSLNLKRSPPSTSFVSPWRLSSWRSLQLAHLGARLPPKLGACCTLNQASGSLEPNEHDRPDAKAGKTSPHALLLSLAFWHFSLARGRKKQRRSLARARRQTAREGEKKCRESKRRRSQVLGHRKAPVARSLGASSAQSPRVRTRAGARPLANFSLSLGENLFSSCASCNG